MFQFAALMGAFFLTNVRVYGFDLELTCPQGWVASDFVDYDCKFYYLSTKEVMKWSKLTENCASCLICRENSTFSKEVGIVEICFISKPSIAQQINSQTKQEFTRKNAHSVVSTDILHQKISCGIMLRHNRSNPSYGSVDPKPCDRQQAGGKTSFLLCPNSFFLLSHFIRSYTIGDTEKESSCFNCQSYFLSNASPLRVTLCYPHVPSNSVVYTYKNRRLSECRNIQKNGTLIYCGVKFETHECIPCQNGNTQHDPVSDSSFLIDSK